MQARFGKGNSSVDWSQVDRELDSLPSDLRTTRFDSLTHVIEILSTVDPKDLVEELTAAKNRLESLIDNVVDVYHNGFNLAIQNYSKILQLFSESREQVDSIQLALTESRRRLGTQNLSLQTHWQRSVKFDSVCKILQDIESVTSIPAQIDACHVQHDWPNAANLLVDACNRMTRKELEKVKGLRKIKDDLCTRWKMVSAKIMSEIENMIYENEAFNFDMTEEATPVTTPSKLALRRLSSFHAGVTPKHGRPSSGFVGTPRGDSSCALSRSNSFTTIFRRKINIKIPEASQSISPQPELSLLSIETLIDCLNQMGCLPELKENLRRGLSTQIKTVIIAVMQSTKNEGMRQDNIAFGPHQPAKTHQNLSIPPALAATSERLLTEVCRRVQVVLYNLTGVFKIISLKDENTNSTEVEYLRRYFLYSQQNSDGPLPTTAMLIRRESKKGMGTEECVQVPFKSLTGREYLDAACLEAWNTVQDEFVQIVAEMLNIPTKQVDSRGTSDSSAAIWLKRLDENKNSGTVKATRQRSGALPERKTRLTFSFGIDLERDIESKALLGHSTHKKEASYALYIKNVLNQSGGTYLTPIVYKAVSDFLSATRIRVLTVLREFEHVSGAIVAETSKALSEGGQRLKAFLENFVMETFLPQVWVDFRGRVTAAMEDQEAFRPQIRTRSKPQRKNDGDLVLRAAIIAEKMIKEVMDWAVSMPPFASSLTGVIENILGRVQEAFLVNINRTLENTVSGKHSQNQELAVLMSLESDAEILADPTRFCVLGPGESIETVTIPAPFPAGSMESELAEREILGAVLNDIPIASESVMARPGHFWRLVKLAALSDSLDFVAKCVTDISTTSESITSPSGVSDNSRSSTKLKRAHRRSNSAGNWEGLSSSLAMIVDRYRSLSGMCIRALRLEMIVLTVHHLSELSEVTHVSDDEENREIPFFVSALIRNAARAQEEIQPHLSSASLQYIFNVLPSACALTLMALLPTFREMNQAGIERIHRILAVMQPAIVSLLSNATATERQKLFEHAHTYYAMLSLSIYDFIDAVRRRPAKFTTRELKALLEVHIPGRRIAEMHFNEIESLTEKTTETRLKRLQLLNTKRNRTHARH